MKTKAVTNQPVAERDYRFDNIKFILIVLVLLGHFMELIEGTSVAYKMIYSFHMPAFLFITGRFAKFDIKKYLTRLILPYIIFQTLYQLFAAYVLSNKEPKIQFTTPYWLLWYLFAVIVYYLFVPLLSAIKDQRLIYLLILLSFIVGIYIGTVESAGYYLSISRIVVFLPFFLMGFYSRRVSLEEKIEKFLSESLSKIVIMILAVIGSIAIVRLNVPVKMLYCSYSYTAAKGYAWMRLLIYMVAILWIIALLELVTNKKIPYITIVGQHTMAIFLMHGFVVKLCKKYEVFKYGLTGNLLLMIVIAGLIVIVFGYQWIKLLFDFVRGKREK